MSEFTGKMDELLKLLQNQRGTRHAIESHPLTDEQHLIKNCYLQHVCAVLLYESTVNDAQRVLLERLIAGVKAENTAERYLGMALGITAESISNLIEDLKKTSLLKYAFALDTLVLCHLNECKEKQAEFLAELIDALALTENDLKYITTFAKAVLTMDINNLREASALRPAYIDKSTFVYYGKLFGEEAVKALLGTTMAELVKIAEGQSGSSVVSYMVINDEERINGYYFVHGEDITFRHCDFSCGNPIKFGNFDKVVFEDCTFTGFTTETIELYDVREALFLRCEFMNCVKLHSTDGLYWRELGSVIQCHNMVRTSVTIDACVFTNCGGKNSSGLITSSVLSNGNIIKCVTSVFNNCWHYHNSGERDPQNRNRVLFSHMVFEENNRIIDSAKLS